MVKDQKSHYNNVQKKVKFDVKTIIINSSQENFYHQGKYVNILQNLLASKNATKTSNKDGNLVVTINDVVESNQRITKYIYSYIFKNIKV